MAESVLLKTCLAAVVLLVFLLVRLLVRSAKPVDAGHDRTARRESHWYGNGEKPYDE
jgi:hypothetical protein